MTALALPDAPPGLDLAGEEGREYVARTAALMADAYADALARIKTAVETMDEQCVRLTAAFKPAPDEAAASRLSYHGFSLKVSVEHYSRISKFEEIELHFRRIAWRLLADRLGVWAVMSIAKAAEFRRQLDDGDLPEVTAENVTQTILGLVAQASDFAAEAAREVFEMLRPHSAYKTNDVFRVGRKVILAYWVECPYGDRLRLSYHRLPNARALEGVFRILDGKAAMTDGRCELDAAIDKAAVGRTEYFKYKAFKNGNLHLEFLRPDLVKELNFHGGGERVLGPDRTAGRA